jgi:truncated hemoglobin YjbI
MKTLDPDLGLTTMLQLMAAQIRGASLVVSAIRPEKRLTWAQCYSEAIEGIAVYTKNQAQVIEAFRRAGLDVQSDVSTHLIHTLE